MDEAEQDFAVEVVQAPIIKPFPEEQFVLVGSSVNLSCEADGIPRPGVAWSVGGYPKLQITVREGTDQVCDQRAMIYLQNALKTHITKSYGGK